MSVKRLSDSAIKKRLSELEDWKLDGDAIKRSLTFETFDDAIDFINRIADHIEDADHHPEIFNVYTRVDLSLTTHDAKGLTDKDFDLAILIDGEVEE